MPSIFLWARTRTNAWRKPRNDERSIIISILFLDMSIIKTNFMNELVVTLLWQKQRMIKIHVCLNTVLGKSMQYLNENVVLE